MMHFKVFVSFALCIFLLPAGILAGYSEKKVVFKSGGTADIDLEGVLSFDSSNQEAPFVIICHPHPRGQGRMDNPILIVLQKQLNKDGFNTLRFNFRGVGGSKGEFGDGGRGTDDLKGALKFVEKSELVKPAQLFVFGYSYGSGVAFLTTLLDRRIDGAVLVGFPTRVIQDFDNFEGINNPAAPMYIVAGGKDMISFRMNKAVTKFVLRTYQKIRLTEIPGADHSFRGAWGEMFRMITDFYQDVITGRINEVPSQIKKARKPANAK